MKWSFANILSLVQLLVAAWQICKYTPLAIFLKSFLQYLSGIAVLRPLGRLLDSPYLYTRKFVDDNGLHLNSWQNWDTDWYNGPYRLNEMKYTSTLQGAGKISFSTRELGGIITHTHNNKTRLFSVEEEDDFLRCLTILKEINNNRFFIDKRANFIAGLKTAVVLSVPELVRLAVMENRFTIGECWGKYIYVNDVKRSDEKILQTLSVSGLWFNLKNWSTLSLVATSIYVVLDRSTLLREKVYSWSSLVSSLLFNNLYFALPFQKRVWLSETLKPWWPDAAPSNPLKRCLDFRVGMKFISLGRMQGCGSVQEYREDAQEKYEATGESRVYPCQLVTLFMFRIEDIGSSTVFKGIKLESVQEDGNRLSFEQDENNNMVAGMADKRGNVLECRAIRQRRFAKVDAVFHYISKYDVTPICSVEDHGIFTIARSMDFNDVLTALSKTELFVATWRVQGLVSVN